MEAFLEALQSKDTAVTDIGIKTDVMKALTVLVRNVPAQMGRHFQSVVECVWACLVDTCDLYPIKSSVYVLYRCAPHGWLFADSAVCFVCC